MRAFSADTQFLNIFDLPFIEGDPRTALSGPRSVILTKEAAQNLYGDTRAVGKPWIAVGGQTWWAANSAPAQVMRHE